MMNKILLTFLISSISYSQMIPKDKQLHMAAGIATYGVSRLIGFNQNQSLLLVGVVAVGKEVYDNNYGGTPEFADVIATIAPALTIKFTLDGKKKIHLRGRKRKNQRIRGDRR